MVFLKTENERVIYSHYMPMHGKHGLGKTEEELLEEGILVESVPDPVDTPGKSPVLYCSDEGVMWYTYEDILVPEDIIKNDIETLRQEDLNNKEAIAELYVMAMGGM